MPWVTDVAMVNQGCQVMLGHYTKHKRGVLLFVGQIATFILRLIESGREDRARAPSIS